MLWKSLEEKLQENVDRVLKENEEDRIGFVQRYLNDLIVYSLWSAATTISDASKFKIGRLDDYYIDREKGELDFKKLKRDVIERLSKLLELEVSLYSDVDETDDFRLIDEKKRVWYVAVDREDNSITVSVCPYWLERELDCMLFP